MKTMVAQAWSVLVLVTLLGSVVVRGLQADVRMLSLVPQGSQIVAGVVSTPGTHQPGRFLLFTLANRIDYEDFISIAASDPSFEVERLIFTAKAGSSAATAEHTVIVSGRVQRDRLFRSARYLTAEQDYRGVTMALVQPFERERRYFQQNRLLAVISSDLALFGTPSSVLEEIDRFLDGNPADNDILEKLSLLDGEDDGWYLVRSQLRRAEVAEILKDLDSKLSEDEVAEELLFGIHYGKRVKLDYVRNAASCAGGEKASQSPVSKMFRDAGDKLKPTTVSVNVPRGRFERWLKQVTEK